MAFRWAVAIGTVLCVIAIVWFVPGSVPARNPVLLILLGLPLIFRLVPRNWLYGTRTPHTMWSSQETWYLHNQFTGIAMLVIGVIWLAVVAVRAL